VFMRSSRSWRRVRNKDHIIPASTSRAAFKLQSKSKAKTELKEYPDRSHYIVGEPGWEEVADDALGWAERNSRSTASIEASIKSLSG
jgi:hypothetical protein